MCTMWDPCKSDACPLHDDMAVCESRKQLHSTEEYTATNAGEGGKADREREIPWERRLERQQASLTSPFPH